MLNLPSLKIGSLLLEHPIIQGGMGVRVSLDRLASAVSNEGAMGVIASVGLGEEDEYDGLPYKQRSALALKNIIRDTKSRTTKPFGVNIMCALTNYEDLVRVCVEERIAAIFSGAGLPLSLPSLSPDTVPALVPIVSSARAADIICKAWHRKYQRLPDGFVIEGPLAGGHLGYKIDQLDNPSNSLINVFRSVKDSISVYEKVIPIPVIVGGGVFTGKDIAYYLNQGADGVQMATRFIATHECDADEKFKQEVIRSAIGDVIVIESPVRMPGRVIKNEFVKKILEGAKIDFECKYQCLRTCDPMSTKYCLAKALVNAYRGKMDRGFVMAGANCYRVKDIVSVKELIKNLVEEAQIYYKSIE